MTTEVARDRKLKAVIIALALLFVALIACLVTAAFAKDSVALLGTLYGAFAGGVGTVLGMFFRANVKVHQAQAGGAS